MNSKTPAAASYVHYTRGTRVGEWRSTEFTSRDEAVAYALANPGKTVIEIASHSTMPHERLTAREDGTIHSERVTSCG